MWPILSSSLFYRANVSDDCRGIWDIYGVCRIYEGGPSLANIAHTAQWPNGWNHKISTLTDYSDPWPWPSCLMLIKLPLWYSIASLPILSQPCMNKRILSDLQNLWFSNSENISFERNGTSNLWAAQEMFWGWRRNIIDGSVKAMFFPRRHTLIPAGSGSVLISNAVLQNYFLTFYIWFKGKYLKVTFRNFRPWNKWICMEM